jgi:hypothetical protein
MPNTYQSAGKFCAIFSLVCLFFFILSRTTQHAAITRFGFPHALTLINAFDRATLPYSPTSPDTKWGHRKMR